MPELPEVETTRQGIEPFLIGKAIGALVCRTDRLRWPIPTNLAELMIGHVCHTLSRRGKYLIAHLPNGHLIIHLGMSGSLRGLFQNLPPKKHDHIDLIFTDGSLLRYHDPRKFGAWLWQQHAPEQHPLLAGLGPEPLSSDFSGDYLYQHAMGRKTAIKNLIMDGRVVVGVGNIYANEALFLAGIRPDRAGSRISRKRMVLLADAIKTVLENAIDQGGTTLRDFVNSHGQPGYFQQQLNVYGRAQQPCRRCGQLLCERRINNRSTVFCANCQH